MINVKYGTMIFAKVFSIFLSIILLAAGCTRSGPNRYSHSDPDFTVDFPAEWELQTGIRGTAIMAVSPPSGPSDSYRENINIVIEDISDKPDADYYYESNLNNLKFFLKNFSVESRSPAEINHHAAQKIVFTATSGAVESKFMMFMMKHKNIGYVITAAATPESFSEFSEAFEKTATSFKIKE
jgi:hypothetical protein